MVGSGVWVGEGVSVAVGIVVAVVVNVGEDFGVFVAVGFTVEVFTCAVMVAVNVSVESMMDGLVQEANKINKRISNNNGKRGFICLHSCFMGFRKIYH
jgi:hypothetical protein